MTGPSFRLGRWVLATWGAALTGLALVAGTFLVLIGSRVDQSMLQLLIVIPGAATCALVAWVQVRLTRLGAMPLGPLRWVFASTVSGAVAWLFLLLPSAILAVSPPQSEGVNWIAVFAGPIAIGSAVCAVPIAQAVILRRGGVRRSWMWAVAAAIWAVLLPVAAMGFGWFNVADTSPVLPAWAIGCVVVLALVYASMTGWVMEPLQLDPRGRRAEHAATE
ncbi:MAG TPA: hypothetical protein VK139_01255 [Microbacteriaceae bacterium]|nr:hypothetical protein [Microbacteriaceae bacterium]